MKKAAQSDPFMAQYKIDSTKLILSKKEKTAQDIEEIKKLLKSAEKLSWYDRTLIAKVGSQYVSISEMEKGLSLFDRAVELRPLWPVEWQQRVAAYYSVAQYYIQSDKKDEAVKYMDMLKDIRTEAIKVNRKNLNPFVFDAITLEKLERLRYAKEKLQSLGKDDMEKLLFNSFNDMDINFDTVPDQWTPSDGISLGMNNTNNTIYAESKNGASGGYIQSRNLSLAEKKKYRIEVEFLNKPADEAVPFVITRLSQQNESLKSTDNVYTAEFSTPEGFKASENALRIFVTGKYEIKNIKITEA
jgi:tetratricopeptide (TPR) repeat protein